MPRSRWQDRRGQLPDVLSIHARPSEANERLFPGHREGDLIKVAGNGFADNVLAERCSRLVMLVKMADATMASALKPSWQNCAALQDPMRQR